MSTTDKPIPRRAALEELVADLRAAYLRAPDSVKAQLAGQYRAALAELDGLTVGEEVSTVDELKSRRAARVSGTDAAAPAGKRKNVGRS